ncbi:uncharacterized protein LOC114569835 isoform X2 [Perca flavescens]|nr:uncharacterized protein LOC114569835 isoform X2 [Perca flavescens]
MTSWKYVIQLFLFVFLIMINLSEEGCYDYFNVTKWKEDLNKTFPLVITKEFKDTIECTLEKKCNQDNHTGISCIYLNQCFEREGDFNSLIRAGKCTEKPQNISFYNFMWLMAKVVNYAKGSDLDTVCNVYPTPPHNSKSHLFCDLRSACGCRAFDHSESCLLLHNCMSPCPHTVTNSQCIESVHSENH